MLQLLYEKNLRFEKLYNGYYDEYLGQKQRQGFGIQLYTNGYIYIGNWKNDFAHGKGLIICPDNTYIMSQNFDIDHPQNITCNFFSKENEIKYQGTINIKGYFKSGKFFIRDQIWIQNLQIEDGKFLSGTLRYIEHNITKFIDIENKKQNKQPYLLKKHIYNYNIVLIVTVNSIQIVKQKNNFETKYHVYNSPYMKAITCTQIHNNNQTGIQERIQTMNKKVMFGECVIQKKEDQKFYDLSGLQQTRKNDQHKISLPYMYYDKIIEKKQQYIYRHLSRDSMEKFKKETKNLKYFNKNFFITPVGLKYYKEIQILDLNNIWLEIQDIFDFYFLYKFRQDKNGAGFCDAINRFFKTNEEQEQIKKLTNQCYLGFQQINQQRPYFAENTFDSETQSLSKRSFSHNSENQQNINYQKQIQNGFNKEEQRTILNGFQSQNRYFNGLEVQNGKDIDTTCFQQRQNDAINPIQTQSFIEQVVRRCGRRREIQTKFMSFCREL